MWLDRFSTTSTPSGSPPPPQNRSYSPTPHRMSHRTPGPSTLRPNFSPRSSSLYQGSKANVSTSSLSSSRVPNGSSLRKQITPPADFVDPVEILTEVLGKPLPKDASQGQYVDDKAETDRPPSLVEEMGFGGLSLHEFLEVDLSSQNTKPSDPSYSVRTAEEYERKGEKFEDLHQSIVACDDVLKSVEVSLTSFQKDLGVVSAEIENLQLRSTVLSTKLENRKKVEKLLWPAVEEISIAPAVVSIICDGPIDQNWVKALSELEKRSKGIADKNRGAHTVVAISDVKPFLDDLTNKAIERIRDYFVSQIKALRSPNINAQIIQQQRFLEFRDLYAFMVRHHAQLADEIGQAYINTMRWYYQTHFSRYRQALEKLSLHMVDKQAALGADQASQRNNLSGGTKTSHLSHDPLAIGRRMDILKKTSQPALTSYLASEDRQTHYLETPFLHFNIALVSNCTFEYTFLTMFFSPSSSQTLSHHFASIFGPTFALGHSFTKALSDPSYDCIGILIAVRLTQSLAFELQRHKCPAADPYINGTHMLLWPRFQLAMDMHADSIRRATASLPSSTRALALSASAATSASQQSTAPHPLTQRFGSFLQGILTLSAEAGDDSEPVGRSLERLRAEFDGFLGRAARGLSAGKRERFLGNNYALVLTIIGETEGKLAAQMRSYFEGLRTGSNAGG